MSAPLNTTSEPPASRHESRLARALRELLTDCRVAALGTLGEDGLPSVSMVPYAIDAAAVPDLLGRTGAQTLEDAFVSLVESGRG